MNSKPAILVFVCLMSVIQVQSIDLPKELGISMKKSHHECVVESGANEDILKKCKDNYIPEDKSSKCYVDCMIRHIQIILEDAAVHVKGIPHELTDQWRDMVTHMRGACGKEEHGDCDTAWERVNCFMKEHDGISEICDLLLFNF